MEQGFFTIPTRVYLTEKQRDKLKNLMRERETDLPDLLTELLVNFLEHQPEPQHSLHSPALETGKKISNLSELEEEIRKRRDEVYRLQKRADLDTHPPRWVKGYIEDLEKEIEQLEQRLRSGRTGRRQSR